MERTHHDLRREYTRATLLEEHLPKTPFPLFDLWWKEALIKVAEPNAMTLSTTHTESLQPTARIVLLKAYSEEGFTFFTNYESRKSEDISSNPNACLSFFWQVLERQVIIQGTIRKTTTEESKAYFSSRPEASKIAARASPQSSIVEDRKSLDAARQYYADLYAQDIPCPPHWGGYRLHPHNIEFWQGRTERLHDRIRYRFLPVEKRWERQRLAP